MQNKILCDFDGTLVTINSFPKWVVFLIKLSLLRGDFDIFFKVLKLLVERKILHKIEHEEFKEKLCRLPLQACYFSKYAVFLCNHTRQSIKEAIARHLEQGDSVIISSAAPQAYLTEYVSLEFGLNHERIKVIGARYDERVFFGNYKQFKLGGLLKEGLLQEKECIDLLYTDSWDDRFLAYISEKICLVKPGKKDLKNFLEEEGLKEKIELWDQ